MVSHDPKRASEWLNLYIEEFMAANIEASLDRSRQVYKVIQDRMAPLQEQVVEAEANLMRYRERDDAVLFADEDQNVISEQLSTLTTEYAQTKADRIRMETKINALRALRGKENLSYATFAEVLQDPTVQALVQERNQPRGDAQREAPRAQGGPPADPGPALVHGDAGSPDRAAGRGDQDLARDRLRHRQPARALAARQHPGAPRSRPSRCRSSASRPTGSSASTSRTSSSSRTCCRARTRPTSRRPRR